MDIPRLYTDFGLGFDYIQNMAAVKVHLGHNLCKELGTDYIIANKKTFCRICDVGSCPKSYSRIVYLSNFDNRLASLVDKNERLQLKQRTGEPGWFDITAPPAVEASV